MSGFLESVRTITIDDIKSWLAENWNSKPVAIAAVAAGSCLVIAYLWSPDRCKRKAAKDLTTIGQWYDKCMSRRKRELLEALVSVKAARGDGMLEILEIGTGAGTNFKYYPQGSQVTCVDHNRYFEEELYKSAEQRPEIRISALHVAPAENMREVKSGTMDAVVSTTVLCSVKDPDRCLQEILRVLKPGGKFFFMEHVKAPAQFYIIRFLQVLLDIPWSLQFGGCHISRHTQDTIRKAGFSRVDLEEFQADELLNRDLTGLMLRTLAPMVRSHIVGTATK